MPHISVYPSLSAPSLPSPTKGEERLEPILPGAAEALQLHLELALELDGVATGEPEQEHLHVVAARHALQLGDGPGGAADHEAALRLPEELRVEAEAVLGAQRGAADADPA